MKLLFCIFLMLISMNLYSLKMNVAVLIYDGVYVLDFTGPIEVFADTYLEGDTTAFNVFTIAEKPDKINAHSGLQVIPDFIIGDSPAIDILIIPGGNPKLLNNNDTLKNKLIDLIDKSKYTMSVCTGAFILSQTGKLDNLEATTWHGALNHLLKVNPTLNVVNKRWTDNGKILTTSGVSAGIDGSLYLVSKIYGKDVADKTARYMDYEYWGK